MLAAQKMTAHCPSRPQQWEQGNLARDYCTKKIVPRINMHWERCPAIILGYKFASSFHDPAAAAAAAGCATLPGNVGVFWAVVA